MKQEKICLGLGNNIDYEVVWNSDVFENWIIRYGIHDEELSTHQPIHTERDLVCSILGFIKSGGGGERFVASSEIIEQFARRFEKKVTLGGTSGRAAIAMRKLGITSALHLVTLNDDVRRLIPLDCPYVSSNPTDSAYPHLIIQFSGNTRVSAGDIDIRASRANRIIYLNDLDNITLNLNEEFASLVTAARVFLISGLNAMHSRELLLQRLETLLRIMQNLPKNARVYYEDACFYDPSLSRLIQSTLADRIGIFGLNEDELQHYLGRDLDLLDAVQIQAALADLRQINPAPLIVVHTRYWALAYGENAGSVAKALKGGVTMATTRYRFGDDFTLENYQETQCLPPREEGAMFATRLNQLLGDKISCVPVAQVEASTPTTVGLGDAFVGGFLPALLP